ncbi:unnamed protein product, partial [marine sediment metagenome]
EVSTNPEQSYDSGFSHGVEAGADAMLGKLKRFYVPQFVIDQGREVDTKDIITGGGWLAFILDDKE